MSFHLKKILYSSFLLLCFILIRSLWTYTVREKGKAIKIQKNRRTLRPECISMKSCYWFFIYLKFFPGKGKRTSCICKIKSSLQIYRKTQTHNRYTDTSSKRYQFGEEMPLRYSHNYIQIHINCDRNWKRDCNCALDIQHPCRYLPLFIISFFRC